MPNDLELLENIEQAVTRITGEDHESWEASTDEPRLDPADEQQIEQLFQQARQHRSKAYVLKRELDRLGVFSDYEDQFLDLFRKPNSRK